MRKLLLVILIATITPTDRDWNHWAEFCGNTMVADFEIPKAIESVKNQGCSDATVVHITDNYYLVYGVKIVRNEY